MWKNRQFYDMVEWMRKRASSDGPYLFGMDCYCKDRYDRMTGFMLCKTYQ